MWHREDTPLFRARALVELGDDDRDQPLRVFWVDSRKPRRGVGHCFFVCEPAGTMTRSNIDRVTVALELIVFILLISRRWTRA